MTRQANRCTFSESASFSSPNWMSSPSLSSRMRDFSRNAMSCRSLSDTARPPWGCGTARFIRISTWFSKNPGFCLRNSATWSALSAMFLGSFSDLDFAVEDAHGIARHHNGMRVVSLARRFATTQPLDREVAAARRHAHRRIEEAASNAGDDRRAGARAAGERLARAALPHAQADLRAGNHLHVARVYALPAVAVGFDARTLACDRRPLDILDHLHGVRVSHREDAHRDDVAVDLERI